MKIEILTLFPEMFEALRASIIGRATSSGKLDIKIINIRDFSEDKHKKCDDTPFGGGAGMVMTPQPLASALKSIRGYKSARKIFMSPSGKRLNQQMVTNLATEKHLIIVCGHYEGIDQRIIDLFNLEEISIGDYVLTGGEIPAMALVDSVSRYIGGVLGNNESLAEESFSSGMLEYPQYTKPREFMGVAVPEVLTSGDHKKIAEWRKARALEKTARVRPDLLNK